MKPELVDEERAKEIAQAAISVATGTALLLSLIEKRQEAQSKAWDSLSRYKFQMFGYWAAIWVHLNALLRKEGHGLPNPFRQLVRKARDWKSWEK